MYVIEQLLYQTSIVSEDDTDQAIFDPHFVTPAQERVEEFQEGGKN